MKIGDTVFIVKYALSIGSIQTGEIDRLSIDPEYLFTKGRLDSFRLGRDMFLTMDEAVQAANLARTKKIASLHKQIKKLNAMRFGQ